MAFSFPFFKKKPEKVIYFGLYFTESRITGFAFEVIAQKANVITQNDYDLTAGYDKILEDIDKLISDLESKANLSLSKTIFFLHSTMLDPQTRDIKEPYKGMLKKVSKELELEPLGYIDLHEAVETNMKENSIINGILLEVSQTLLTVFIYKGGVLSNTNSITRTDSISADLNASVESLPKKIVLPTKIILYGVGDLAKISSDIATFKWDEKVFVQHPTIDVLKDAPLNQILADTFVEELLEQDGKTSVAREQSNATTVPPAASGPQSFGFVFGQDVKSSTAQPPAVDPAASPVAPVQSEGEGSLSFIEQVKEKMSGVSKPFENMSGGGAGLKIIIPIIVLIALIGGMLFGYEYFVHVATVEVKVATSELAKEYDIDLNVVESANPKELAVIKHSKVAEYADEKITTGKRDVGEKAKGDIILHNFDNEEKTIARGTELVYKNLKFILDSDVKIASSSGITSDGVKQSGKAKATVTASDIGSDYNIDKGSQLKVGSLSESLFVGIADANFTGGSKKQVTTVSKKDMEELKSNVEDEVEKKSEGELSKSVTKDEVMLPDLTEVAVKDTDYSGEVGEEAKNIKIKASSEIEYYTVKKDDLKKKAIELIEKEKKDSYKIDTENIMYKITEAEVNKDGDEVKLTVQVDAVQFKEVDQASVKKKIALKSISQIDDILKSEFDAKGGSVIRSTPSLPLISSWVPLFPKNITIKTSTK